MRFRKNHLKATITSAYMGKCNKREKGNPFDMFMASSYCTIFSPNFTQFLGAHRRREMSSNVTLVAFISVLFLSP